MSLRYLRGPIIRSIDMDEDSITLYFDGNHRITLSDEGQCCCERRYMTTDDDLQSLIGQRFVCWEVKDGPSDNDSYDEHDTQFLEIKTETGFVTLVNHNEHNGYYGGFDIVERYVDPNGEEVKSDWKR